MPRATPLLLLLLAAAAARAADVFVVADSANQTGAIAAAARETIAAANELVLADNDTRSDADALVRKKRTFGDIVFRGLADVLGYNVARRAPQVLFPPPLAPVPGIDTPLPVAAPQDAPLQIPFAIVPLQAAPPAPCGRAAAPAPCAPPPPPPKPKAAPPPCPKPRAIPKPKPKPKPRPKPQPKPQPPPCGSGRANPTTAAPCGAAPPKADSNLETISSNFQLDFNFNRNPAAAASVANEATEEQPPAQAQQRAEAFAPAVAIRPQAAPLPPEPPRNPRVYLDAYVVQNGVTQKIQTIDAKNVAQHRADNDYLAYDEPAEPAEAPGPPPREQAQGPARDDDYDYAQDSGERGKSVREFGTAVDQFWDQNKKKQVPASDYRSVHFGDRDLANQLSDQGEPSDPPPDTHRALTQQPAPAAPPDEEDEPTTSTHNPRRRLKPRVLPPTEKNPNQIDTITVRVPPIYKEKRPKKLHREPQTEAPPEPDDDSLYKPYEYSYPGSDDSGYYPKFHTFSSRPGASYRHASDADSENSAPAQQTEQPRRKRRRKSKRRTRSAARPQDAAGDFDYYGNKLPISAEEEYFRGLTIPPPTRDADLARLEQARAGDGHFLDDHERLRDDPERIKDKKKGSGKERSDREGGDEAESDEAERSGEAERADEGERSGEQQRSERLGPNARVRETTRKNNYVHAHNVQVDDAQPLVRSVRRKKPKSA